MEVNLRPLKKHDLDTFPKKFHDDTFKASMLWNIDRQDRECIHFSFDKIVIAILGLNYTHSGAADLWMVPSINIDKYPMKVFKEIKRLIDMLLVKDMHRLQIYIKEGWGKGHKWARALGFKLEGIARKYDGIGDYACYAKVRS